MHVEENGGSTGDKVLWSIRIMPTWSRESVCVSCRFGRDRDRGERDRDWKG